MDDKIKRLMDHTNVDEKTAKEALEKNNDNVLDAFAYLEKEKASDGKDSVKETKKEKKYVEYNQNHRYMDSDPKKPNKVNKIKKEKPVPVKQQVTASTEAKEVDKPKIELKNEPAATYKMPDYKTYDNYDKQGYSGDYYAPSKDEVEQYKEYTNPNLKGVIRQIADWFLGAFDYLIQTKLIIMRKNNVIISVPIFLAIIITLVAFYGVLPFFIFSLFFGFRYFVESKNDSSDDLESRIKNTYKYEEHKKTKSYRKPPYESQNYNYPQGQSNPNAPYYHQRNKYTNYYNQEANSSEQGNNIPPDYKYNENANNYSERNSHGQNQNGVGYYNYGGYEKKDNKEYFDEVNKFQGKNNIIDLDSKKE